MYDVKQQVATLLSVPIPDQKLLYLGRPLQGELLSLQVL